MLDSTRLPKPEEAPKWARARQLAAWLDCTDGTIRNWVRQGLLPKPKSFGPRRLFFHVEEVRKALLRLEEVGPEAVTQKAKPAPQRKKGVKR